MGSRGNGVQRFQLGIHRHQVVCSNARNLRQSVIFDCGRCRATIGVGFNHCQCGGLGTYTLPCRFQLSLKLTQDCGEVTRGHGCERGALYGLIHRIEVVSINAIIGTELGTR